jgi:hypothetical protein
MPLTLQNAKASRWRRNNEQNTTGFCEFSDFKIKAQHSS